MWPTPKIICGQTVLQPKSSILHLTTDATWSCSSKLRGNTRTSAYVESEDCLHSGSSLAFTKPFLRHGRGLKKGFVSTISLSTLDNLKRNAWRTACSEKFDSFNRKCIEKADARRIRRHQTRTLPHNQQIWQCSTCSRVCASVLMVRSHARVHRNCTTKDSIVLRSVITTASTDDYCYHLFVLLLCEGGLERAFCLRCPFAAHHV